MNRPALDEIITAFATAVADGKFQAAEGWTRLAIYRAGLDPLTPTTQPEAGTR